MVFGQGFLQSISFIGNPFNSRNVRLLNKAIHNTINQPVNSIMTKEVISVGPESKLNDAIKLMVRKNISCVVVKDQEVPVGILTERDILMKLPLDSKKVVDMKVKDLMSGKPVCGTPQTSLFEASNVMISNHFRKYPIVEEGRLVGLITQTDLVRSMEKFATHTLIETVDLCQVRHVMSTTIISAPKHSKFVEARKIMQDHNISCILTLNDQGMLSGIFTEKNFLEQVGLNLDRLNILNLENIMVYPVVSINPDLTIFKANLLMLNRNFRRLPVVVDNMLMGIITQTDLHREMYKFLGTTLFKINSGQLKEVEVQVLS
ncbi:hypothetical protein COV16_05430 [Candidatus Woesearchaeota archaeon CG10_big_fil_rev_8_21_14_0_10_34_8]|nr:MAG: hypothetical protein COV16_05430 [Candidatus Woesearchaeota archaeon CG10_big_fil_rev_8_21_14_0_10_34_8]